MEIKKMKLDLLKPAEYNPRIDLQPGDPEYEHLKSSISRFGHVQPIVWNERTGHIVGGHQTVKVLRDLGEAEEVECVVVYMGEAEEKALNIALNKVKGRWDMDKLSGIMEELIAEGMEVFTGFDEKEIEKLVEEAEAVVLSASEIDARKYDEESFRHKCPRCGFLY